MAIKIFLLLFLGFIHAEKRLVEITFNKITQLNQLVEMGIDLDHHRNLREVHAFVTDDEFQLILQMDFGIREIPNKAKLYFEELRQNTMDSRNPMEEYHNYIELTAFLQDVANEYSLEFYNQTLKQALPTDIAKEIEIVKDRLDSETQFSNFGFTINTKDIVFGPQRCSYTTIKDLPLKIANQIRIADKISSIEPDFVVASVLRTHLIPDMVGNTRAYLTQRFRCKECQYSMRRVPINGKCSRCEGEIITNMFKNSVTKYLGISKKLAKEHDVGNYLTNRIEMIDQEMHDTFPNIKPDERIKQQYLDKFLD